MDSHAPFDDRFARSVQTPEEAEIVLHAFIREGQQADSQHHVREKSKGYDLYLPWLMEVVEYVIPLEDHEPLGLLELQQLYLDVAWRMVMKGVLRPGPKMVNAATDTNIYGLAFTLMQGVEI